jgi:hypothetical protein
VLPVSSGAALVLSLPAIRPEAMRLSGGYIGAKRVIWLVAHNANGIAEGAAMVGADRGRGPAKTASAGDRRPVGDRETVAERWARRPFRRTA